MKKWVENIVIVAAYLLCCILSKYDADNKFWFVSMAIWLAGSYYLIKSLKLDLDAEIDSLKKSTGSGPFIYVFSSTAIVAALFIALFAFSFTGSFRFEAVTYSASLLEGIINGALFGFGLLMILVFVCFVVMVPVGAILSSLLGYDSQFANKLFMHLISFTLLSYVCGAIDALKLVKVIATAWSSIGL